MPRKSKVIEQKELTEDELEMIHWRATRGCHFEGGFLFASEYGKEVIQNDVPLLIAEIRRLRAVEQSVQSDETPAEHEKRIAAAVEFAHRNNSGNAFRR